MRFLPTFIATAGLSLAVLTQAATVDNSGEHGSKYAGQEKRTIKSLSPDDIKELQKGAGWGLAKAAELNGVPGPAHLLELKKEIGLSKDQVEKIQTIYEQMKVEAIELGNQLIAHELALEKRFQGDIPSAKELKSLLDELGAIRSQLRFVHLATHLKTPDILSGDQISSYNKLRGYSSNDPCNNVPKGHNAKMWKKHNGCT